ncbi:LOW QUALITY PROTEIN: uncharacterized protein EMH_0061830, partial [Eimeria mitis]
MRRRLSDTDDDRERSDILEQCLDLEEELGHPLAASERVDESNEVKARLVDMLPTSGGAALTPEGWLDDPLANIYQQTSQQVAVGTVWRNPVVEAASTAPIDAGSVGTPSEGAVKGSASAPAVKAARRGGAGKGGAPGIRQHPFVRLPAVNPEDIHRSFRGSFLPRRTLAASYLTRCGGCGCRTMRTSLVLLMKSKVLLSLMRTIGKNQMNH